MAPSSPSFLQIIYLRQHFKSDFIVLLIPFINEKI